MQTEAHPLFLPEDEDDEPVNVSEVQICRIENGQQVFYPRVFPATELRSLEHLHAELGGGSYILIARHEGRITTRRKCVLPGKPRPMYDESRQEQPATATQAAPTTLDPMAALMGGQGGGFMPLIMLMFQQQSQASDRQMQMFMAMMESSRSSSAEDKAAARAEMNANVERERIASERMMTLMREAMVKPAGDSNGFTQGVEFMRAFSMQQIELVKASAGKNDGDSELGSLLETLSMAFQAFSMAKGSGGLPEGVPTAAAEAAS